MEYLLPLDTTPHYIVLIHVNAHSNQSIGIGIIVAIVGYSI